MFVIERRQGIDDRTGEGRKAGTKIVIERKQ